MIVIVMTMRGTMTMALRMFSLFDDEVSDN